MEADGGGLEALRSACGVHAAAVDATMLQDCYRMWRRLPEHDLRVLWAFQAVFGVHTVERPDGAGEAVPDWNGTADLVFGGMRTRQFVERLVAMDLDGVPAEAIEKLDVHFAAPRFGEGTVSGAFRPLVAWLRALRDYHRAKVVQT